VVPEEAAKQPWISGRSHAACGLVGGHTLRVMGGLGPHGPVQLDSMACFDITRGNGEALAAAAAARGD
jgi:hypothetical protein